MRTLQCVLAGSRLVKGSPMPSTTPPFVGDAALAGRHQAPTPLTIHPPSEKPRPTAAGQPALPAGNRRNTSDLEREPSDDPRRLRPNPDKASPSSLIGLLHRYRDTPADLGCQANVPSCGSVCSGHGGTISQCTSSIERQFAMDPEQVSARFGLGDPVGVPVIAASGWGQRNVVWRLETRLGVWAVKDVIEPLLPDDPDEALRIEFVAHAGRVPSAEPVPALSGACFEELNGHWYRCHRWVDGTAKQNEDTNEHDALEMGKIVGHLHSLKIPTGQPRPASRFGTDHWLQLARTRPSSPWAALIVDHVDAIERTEALGAESVDPAHIGTHCDLNAHNVLFTSNGLVLIDWDAAGPDSAIYETMSTATLWAQRHDGRLDIDIAKAFLGGYQESGGTVHPDDVAALSHWLAGLSWWTERNVRIAIEQPSDHHDELATALIGELIRGIETVNHRRTFLREVISRS